MSDEKQWCSQPVRARMETSDPVSEGIAVTVLPRPVKRTKLYGLEFDLGKQVTRDELRQAMEPLGNLIWEEIGAPGA